MKTKSIITNVALALTLGVVYTSCNKTTDSVLDTDTSSSTDNSTSDNAFSGIFKSVSQASDTSSHLKALVCPQVTISAITGTGWPRTVTIDYGTAGCDNRKGKIIAVLSGPFRTPSSTITITTNNYYDGLNKIDAGTHTVTNITPVTGHPTFSVSVTGAVITTPGGVVSWNTQRTITWIEGDTTINAADDVYLISGQASGTSAKGVTFTANITTPLRVARSCQWIESGVITLTPAGKAARTIDFGTSGCDANATVIINGKSYPVTM